MIKYVREIKKNIYSNDKMTVAEKDEILINIGMLHAIAKIYADEMEKNLKNYGLVEMNLYNMLRKLSNLEDDTIKNDNLGSGTNDEKQHWFS